MNATYRGNDKVLVGFILGLLSFWLFAMTLLNVRHDMNADLGMELSTLNFAVSITSLVSGICIVVLGGLADRFGRVRMVNYGFFFGLLGALFIAFTPGHSAATAPLLITGRVFQGLSGACIMPASLALLNVYWDERGRQRAVSLWSMGTWGGTSFASLFGGFMASYLGWRSIFIIGAIACAVGYLLVKGMPESKAAEHAHNRFDVWGFISFIIFVVSLQLYVSMGAEQGWGSTVPVVLLAISIIALVGFVLIERRVAHPFIDLGLFKNSVFTGATVSNFLLNGTAGVVIISLSLVQMAAGVSADVAGYLTIGYGVSILLFIRLGERFLQKYGPRKPMLWGTSLLILSVILLLQSQVMTQTYMILMSVAFILFGTGLAFYATPSTDAALSNLPIDQSGSGSGIYKMASSLGASFGLAISMAIYSAIHVSGAPLVALSNAIEFIGRQDNLHFRHAGMMAMLFNLIILLLAVAAIVLTVPKGKLKSGKSTGR